MFAGVAAVLVAFALAGNHFLTGSHSQSDESAYLYFARNLTHGRYAVAGEQSDGLYLWHGPGLPLILAPFVALHLGVEVMRLMGPLSLLAAGILFMLLLRRWVSPWLALAGGIALSIFPPFLRLLPKLYSEPVALMLLVAGLLALVKAHESGRVRWCLASGVLGGLMILTRVDIGWLVLVALVLAAIVAASQRTRVHALNLLAIATAVVVCAPWLAYTGSLSHKFPYWASSGGESLYWMAAPVGTGSWASYQQVLTDPRWLAQRPLFERLAAVPQVQRDAELQHIALRLIRTDPGVYLRHLADNLSRMIIGGPYTFQTTGAGRYLLYGAPDLALLLAVVLAAVWLVRTHRAPMPRMVLAIGAFAILNILLHLPVAAYPRMTTLSTPGALAVVAIAAEGLLGARLRAGA